MQNISDGQSGDIEVKDLIYLSCSVLLFIPLNPAHFSTVLPISQSQVGGRLVTKPCVKGLGQNCTVVGPPLSWWNVMRDFKVNISYSPAHCQENGPETGNPLPAIGCVFILTISCKHNEKVMPGN